MLKLGNQHIQGSKHLVAPDMPSRCRLQCVLGKRKEPIKLKEWAAQDKPGRKDWKRPPYGAFIQPQTGQGPSPEDPHWWLVFPVNTETDINVAISLLSKGSGRQMLKVMDSEGPCSELTPAPLGAAVWDLSCAAG
ncbi:hypothetical protein NQZ68_004569 [Dissostichus eleginoides]|nr:hypothetical protein NQZ68_004569 [Dissostichus eleginoides]